ncbi:MAG: hypothetical protein JO031_05120 [Ktedonobacteraceae bacterium]|nr:hypothetical protein [Ktedonobacteraceae bacterium]
MPTFACESRQPLTHRAIETLDEGRIEHRASLARKKQLGRLQKAPLCDPADDLHHPFLLGALDHRGNSALPFTS